MDKRSTARARAELQATIRAFLSERGYEEVETPYLVPAPGMEPHIDAFRTPFIRADGVESKPLWLHTSPEYAMKRLVAEGFSRIFQLARVFRNEEVSTTHNPEFTMLELYRADTDYEGVMRDIDELLECCARELTGGTRIGFGGRTVDLSSPFPRLRVADAFSDVGVDLASCGSDTDLLRRELARIGLGRGAPEDGYDDLFFRVFLERIEPNLGRNRPVFLVDWPASMAALARLKESDPRWAERFELYAGGLELANGFSELIDPAEQRRRFESERALRARLGRPDYPIDERLLDALARMPPTGGVAVGLDRLLMLLTGATAIDEVLLFPARDFLG